MGAEGRLANTAAVFVGAAAVQRAAPFVLLLVLARVVPVNTFGQFGVLTSLFTLIFVVAGLGLEAAAFRGVFAATTEREKATYYANLAKIALVGPLVIGLPVAAALAVWHRHFFGIDSRAIALVVTGAAIYGAATTVPLARLRAQNAVVAYAVCAVMPTMLQVLTKFVCCVTLDLGTAGWAIGDVVAGITALCLTTRFQWADLISWPPSAVQIGQLLRLSLPLLPHVMSSWILSLSDRVLIAGLVGITAAGQYGLVAQLANVGMILSTELNRALAPEYGRAIAGGEASTERLARVIRIQRLLSVAIFAATAAGSLVFIYFVAPAAYHAGAGWALVLCSGLLLYSWYYPPMNVLSITEGRTARMPFITAASAVVNVAVNVALLPSFGAVVAAYSTVLGYALLLVLTSLYAGGRHALKWSPRIAAAASSTSLALAGAGTLMVSR